MVKIDNDKAMKINGGHIVTAYPATDREASKPGVAGWERDCPKSNHTRVHIFDRVSYTYMYGTGRTYVCPVSSCNFK